MQKAVCWYLKWLTRNPCRKFGPSLKKSYLSHSLCSRQFVDQSLFLSLSLRLRKSVNRSLLDPLYPSIHKPLIRNHLTNGLILVYHLSKLKNPTILTPNDHKYPQFRWPRLTSKTIWSRFENLRIMTQNDPNYPKFGVKWPWEPFFSYIIPYMISLSLKILV